MSVYLELFHGRNQKEYEPDIYDWGDDGPILGPLDYVRVTNLPTEEGEFSHAELNGGVDIFLHPETLLYYDGMWYGDFFITSEKEALAQVDRIEKPDAEKMVEPE